MITSRIVDGIIITITVVWVCSFVLSILRPEYRADPQINLIFMSIVGGSVALKFRKSKTDDRAGE